MPRLIQIQLIFTVFLVVFTKQLPDSLIPVEYKLEIITNLGDEDGIFSFRGSVAIHIRCDSPTDNITLHSKNLKIDDGKTTLKCLNETGDIPTVSETSLDAENDFLILQLSQTLQAGHHYEVLLYFQGDLEEERVGYYRGSYLDENKVPLWFAVTYFKPDNARRAFPCFDELTYKAKFTISLGRSTKYNSLSNMPLLETQQMENIDDWVWDRFKTTPPMPTYLVGFIVIKYKSQEIERNRHVVKFALSVWGANDVITSELIYTLRYSQLFFRLFETHLKMRYPLPKLDVIAIPKYAVPVMECWGLIIWEEDYLVRGIKAIMSFNSEILKIMAEQIIRQILVNVVTITSWTDQWFVEGFAAYVLPILVDKLSSSQEHDSDIANNIISVFNFDSLQNSHAVLIRSEESGSVVATVDPNTIKKASLLVSMMSGFLGYENFCDVIHQYLTIYKYKNAGSKELLELIDKKSPLRNVAAKTIMNSWITQAGFPLITVTRNYKTGTLEVKQERFFMDDQLLGADTTRWWIPLTYTTECELEFNKTVVKKWLPPNGDSISIKGPVSHGDWVIFNVGASGLYMVNYDEDNWNLIIDYLNEPFFKQIPRLNRVLLIESAARLAWTGRLNYRIFLDMIKYIVKDEDTQPHSAALGRIYDLNILLRRMPVHRKFVNYIKRIFKPGMSRNLRINNDVSEFMLMRGRMMSGSCSYDMEYCGNEPMHPRVRSPMNFFVKSWVYSEEIFCSNEVAKKYTWSIYAESKHVQIFDVLISLSCSKNQTLLRDYLEEFLQDKLLKTEYIVSIIVAVRKSIVAFDLLSAFLSKNIKTLYDRIFPNVRELSRLIFQIGRHTVVESELTWFKNFIDTNQKYFQDIPSEVDAALEIARLNVQWLRKNYRSIEIYFGENVDD